MENVPRVGFHFPFPRLLQCRCSRGDPELLSRAQEDQEASEESVSAAAAGGELGLARCNWQSLCLAGLFVLTGPENQQVNNKLGLQFALQHVSTEGGAVPSTVPAPLLGSLAQVHFTCTYPGEHPSRDFPSPAQRHSSTGRSPSPEGFTRAGETQSVPTENCVGFSWVFADVL